MTVVNRYLYDVSVVSIRISLQACIGISKNLQICIVIGRTTLYCYQYDVGLVIGIGNTSKNG